MENEIMKLLFFVLFFVSIVTVTDLAIKAVVEDKETKL